MNVLALNVGYHNEHHDLMRVPWTKLPALKRLAPELYEPLHFHRSWSALLWRFLTDPSITLYSRVIGRARSPEPAASSPPREASPHPLSERRRMEGCATSRS